jgi:hypothetical protein
MDYILIGLVAFALGIIVGKYFLSFRETTASSMGTPQPHSVDCSIWQVQGTLSGTNPDPPDDYRAKIFDTCPSTSFDPTTLPSLSNSGSHPDFVLEPVEHEPGLNDPVCIVVWAHYTTPTGGDVFRRGDKPNVSCGCSGSGNGNALLSARQSEGAPRQEVADTAPLKCQIDVRGFAPAALAVFNRNWNLLHRENCCGGLTWDNGGDGAEEPRVELATESPFGTPWNLTFRLGEIVISYTKSSEEWRALAANTFHSVTASGVSADAILPASVTVVPA